APSTSTSTRTRARDAKFMSIAPLAARERAVVALHLHRGRVGTIVEGVRADEPFAFRLAPQETSPAEAEGAAHALHAEGDELAGVGIVADHQQVAVGRHRLDVKPVGIVRE